MNSLNKDLKFKVVIFKQEVLEDSIKAEEHPFFVTTGFGASPYTGGGALIGAFLSDGEEARMEGDFVERFATEEEITSAQQHMKVLGEHNIEIERVIGENDG